MNEILQPLFDADTELEAAKAKKSQTFKTLLKRPWGRITNLSWDADHEYSDEGGTYLITSNATITLEDGTTINLGDPNEMCSDYWADDFETDELGEEIAKRLDNLAEGVDFKTQLMAELSQITGLTSEELEAFLELTCQYIGEYPEDDELVIGPQPGT